MQSASAAFLSHAHASDPEGPLRCGYPYPKLAGGIKQCPAGQRCKRALPDGVKDHREQSYRDQRMNQRVRQIEHLEVRLRQLKVQQTRAEARQRLRASRQARRDDTRR